MRNIVSIVIGLVVCAGLWVAFSLLGSGCASTPPGDVSMDAAVPNTDATVDAPTQHYTFCQGGGSELTHGCCTDGAFPRPAELEPGMWLRTTRSSTVYYIGSDGRRYVFPTQWTLVSWGYAYNDPRLASGEADLCRDVVMFPDSTVNVLPIGGNVRYRPGSYATGIESDPSRWVVSRGGTLRRLTDPGMVEQVYAPQAPEDRLRLLPEPFFPNYRTGAPPL